MPVSKPVCIEKDGEQKQIGTKLVIEDVNEIAQRLMKLSPSERFIVRVHEGKLQLQIFDAAKGPAGSKGGECEPVHFAEMLHTVLPR